MQQLEAVKISHPYIASISNTLGGYEVVLSDAFPLAFRKFILQPGPTIWGDIKELESNLGMIEEDRVFWLRGSGNSYGEAVHDALSTLVSWVVHPENVIAQDFRLRELGSHGH